MRRISIRLDALLILLLVVGSAGFFLSSSVGSGSSGSQSVLVLKPEEARAARASCPLPSFEKDTVASANRGQTSFARERDTASERSSSVVDSSARPPRSLDASSDVGSSSSTLRFSPPKNRQESDNIYRIPSIPLTTTEESRRMDGPPKGLLSVEQHAFGLWAKFGPSLPRHQFLEREVKRTSRRFATTTTTTMGGRKLQADHVRRTVTTAEGMKKQQQEDATDPIVSGGLSVAVEMSGHMRTWRKCRESMKEHLLRPNQASLFISTYPDLGDKRFGVRVQEQDDPVDVHELAESYSPFLRGLYFADLPTVRDTIKEWFPHFFKQGNQWSWMIYQLFMMEIAHNITLGHHIPHHHHYEGHQEHHRQRDSGFWDVEGHPNFETKLLWRRKNSECRGESGTSRNLEGHGKVEDDCLKYVPPPTHRDLDQVLHSVKGGGRGVSPHAFVNQKYTQFDIVIRARPDLYILGPTYILPLGTQSMTSGGQTHSSKSLVVVDDSTTRVGLQVKCVSSRIGTVFDTTTAAISEKKEDNHDDGRNDDKMGSKGEQGGSEGGDSSSLPMMDPFTVGDILRVHHHPRIEWDLDPISDHTGIGYTDNMTTFLRLFRFTRSLSPSDQEKVVYFHGNTAERIWSQHVQRQKLNQINTFGWHIMLRNKEKWNNSTESQGSPRRRWLIQNVFGITDPRDVKCPYRDKCMEKHHSKKKGSGRKGGSDTCSGSKAP